MLSKFSVNFLTCLLSLLLGAELGGFLGLVWGKLLVSDCVAIVLKNLLEEQDTAAERRSVSTAVQHDGERNLFSQLLCSGHSSSMRSSKLVHHCGCILLLCASADTFTPMHTIETLHVTFFVLQSK